jgi:hypothetical protein
LIQPTGLRPRLSFRLCELVLTHLIGPGGQKKNVKLVAMADAFADRLQKSLATIQSDPALASKIKVAHLDVHPGDTVDEAVGRGRDCAGNVAPYEYAQWS